MEDDFELVSKKKIQDLRNENKKLKTQIQNQTEEKVDDKLIEKIIQTMQKESQKERELIISTLNDVKELNKSTLDNVLIKNQELDSSLEVMIDTLEDMVKSLELITKKDFSQNENNKIDTKEVLSQLNILNKNNMTYTNINLNIGTKLNEIELFMKNLRVLLSYVKPADIVIDKSSNTNNQPN